jgi:hypothetical protein
MQDTLEMQLIKWLLLSLYAFQMSFLKKVYLKMAEIEKQITVANNEEEADFLLRLKNNLNVAFKLLIDTKISAKYFNYAYPATFSNSRRF